MSPIYDPKNEPKTIVVGGVKDDRDYLTKAGVDQYSTSDALVNELFVSMENKSCTLDRADMKPRFGVSGSYFNGSVSKICEIVIHINEICKYKSKCN